MRNEPGSLPMDPKKEPSQQCYAALFRDIPEAIVLADREGCVRKVNDEFCRMFGYEEADTVGCHIDDLVAHEERRTEALAITEAVARGEKFSLEAVRRRKDGTLIHVSIIGVPVMTDDGDVLVFGIYRDISERIRNEQALAEAQRHLEETNAQLELISNIDGLTAIPNRRNFEQFYDLEWRRLCREKKCLSLIMIDIDCFKTFNDCYGHVMGDQCLKQVAHSLRVVNRAGDLVARYGGEEFVAVLSNTDENGARKIAEKMRQRVRALRIAHARSPVDSIVTVSIGIATLVPIASMDRMDVLMKADQALYHAKSGGRDRVESISLP